jgi:transposase
VRWFSIISRVLDLPRTVVESAWFEEDTQALVFAVRPHRRWGHRCPLCRRRCPRYDNGAGPRRWRTLDIGVCQAYVEADAPRVRCPEHGVIVAAVPWARHDAGHTRAFDDLAAWLVRHTSKTAVAQLLRISWRTVGNIVTRVVADADAAAGDRLAGVTRIGIDEVSYKRRHKYLTVVVDHDTGRLLWIAEGRDKKTLAAFFDTLGDDRCAQITLVSADGADWIADLVGLRCPNAKLCMDPFHVVVWVQHALDLVRRGVWNTLRRNEDTAGARAVARSRFALWRNPEDLTDKQKTKLDWIAETNAPLYKAYLLKEQLRQVFAPGGAERITRLDLWLDEAADSGLTPFIDLARNMRRYRDDIANALTHNLSNARVESLNTKIRLLTRIAFGFKSATALIALVRLHLCGYELDLPGRT